MSMMHLHSSAPNTNHNIINMMKATNFIVFNKSFQASSLGDTSLLSIVGTIQVLLYVLEELLRHQHREHHRKSPILKIHQTEATQSYFITKHTVTYLNVRIICTTHHFSSYMTY